MEASTPRGRRRLPAITADQVIAHVGGRNAVVVTPDELVVIADASVVHKLRWHSANRDIHRPHVEALKSRIVLSLVQAVPEPIALMVGLVRPDMADHLEALRESPEPAEFQLPIIDGQHRWTALKELMNEMAPDVIRRVVIKLTVYLCNDDAHLARRLETVNFVHKWGDADHETVRVRNAFVRALDLALGEEWSGRKPTKTVAGCAVLRDESWTRQHWGTGDDVFEHEIRKLAQSEHAEEWKQLAKGIRSSLVLAQAIRGSQLWQLADTTHEWIRLIEGARPRSPKRGAKRVRK
jgi:hypothetical protein